jgi:hypothetical protein
MRGVYTTDMGQWFSGYDRRKSAHKSDDDVDGIFGELFHLFFSFLEITILSLFVYVRMT